MSDFLSKFSGDNYEDLLKEDQQKKAEVAEVKTPATSVSEDIPPLTPPDAEAAVPTSIPEEPVIDDKSQDIVNPSPYKPVPEPVVKAEEPPMGYKTYLESSRRSTAEDTVKDPTYQQKQRKQWLIAGIAGSVLLLLVFFLWYQFSHVRLPDFEGKSLSEARVWGAKNKIDFNPTLVFSNDFTETQIIRQDPEPDRNIRKGSTVDVDVSKGSDPDERISLPDFANLSYEEAQIWVEQQKATGVSLILQYDAVIPRFMHIKTEFRNPDVSADNYRRKDVVIVYYSRGEEQFDKSINVPSFAGKAKAEVDTWASTNGVKVTYVESTSSTIAQGFVIAQSVSSGTKIARNDPFEITLSLGKAVVVPNYAGYSAEEAATVPGLSPLIVTRYSDMIPYGSLISQSLPPGAELTDKDDKSIKLVYSLGLPYLDDLRGTMNEGELQKYFYDTYKAKGANVGYYVEYVSSSEIKGTVVGMSSYSRLVPLNFVVKIAISLGDGGTYDPSNPTAPPPTVPGGPPGSK